MGEQLDRAIERCNHLKDLIRQFEEHLRAAPDHRKVYLEIAIDFLKKELSKAGHNARKFEN